MNRPVTRAITQMDRLADADRIKIGTLADTLSGTSHSALLLVAALTVVTPLSGIPGLSTLCGLVIALVSAQILVGKSRVYLPRRMREKTVSAKKVHRLLGYVRQTADRAERHSSRRLTVLVRRPVSVLLQAICLLCGLLMPLMEAVPFTSSILGGVVAIFAAAMLLEDGLVALFGLIALGGVIFASLSAFTGLV